MSNPNNAHLSAAPCGVPAAPLKEIPLIEGEDHPHGVSAHVWGGGRLVCASLNRSRPRAVS